MNCWARDTEGLRRRRGTLRELCVRGAVTTVQYPEQRIARSRRRATFHSCVRRRRLGERVRCVAADLREGMPAKCIYIVKSTDKKPDALGKMQIYPARFDIDISVCMSCQIAWKFARLRRSRWTRSLSWLRPTALADCAGPRGTVQVKRTLSQDSSDRSCGSGCAFSGRKVKAMPKPRLRRSCRCKGCWRGGETRDGCD